MAEGSTSKRVIILGAGITGLSAGIRFLGSGCDVSILEKAEFLVRAEATPRS